MARKPGGYEARMLTPQGFLFNAFRPESFSLSAFSLNTFSLLFPAISAVRKIIRCSALDVRCSMFIFWFPISLQSKHLQPAVPYRAPLPRSIILTVWKITIKSISMVMFFI